MRRHKIHTSGLITALSLLPLLLWAQPKDNSPLSRFGIGDLVSQEFVPSATMGGIGAVYRNIHQANIVNPATLSYLESTSLNIGLFAQRTNIEKGSFNSNVWSGNIDYFALSFPVINPINEILERRETKFSWGMNFTLRPNSRVGYNINSTAEQDSIGTVDHNFQGNGGTYVFQWGNGFRYKNLSFGFSLGYLFGQTDYSGFSSFPDLINDYRHVRIQEISYRGLVWNVGGHYSYRINGPDENNPRRKLETLSIGLHYSGNTNFNSRTDIVDYVINDAYLDRDTAVYVIDDEREGVLPGTFGVGLMYEKAQALTAGVNFSARPWSNYENEARPEILMDTWRLGFGAAYTPDATSITSFFKRVEYRVGFHYQTDPRSLEGEQGFEYGISAGLGLPFILQRQFSFVNFNFEYGRRGMETVLKENFFRVSLGLSLNDNQWFIKRRYN